MSMECELAHTPNSKSRAAAQIIIERMIFVDKIPDLPNEEWRDVSGYPKYQISNLGRIKSFKNPYTRILKTFVNNYGYPRVALCKNG